MRQSQKDDLRILRDRARIHFLKHDPAAPFEEFVHLMDRQAGRGFRCDMRQGDLRMPQEVAQEFAAGVTRGADYGYANHLFSLPVLNNITISPIGALADKRAAISPAEPRINSS